MQQAMRKEELFSNLWNEDGEMNPGDMEELMRMWA